MHFSQKHKLLDIWVDLSSSLFFGFPRRGQKRRAHVSFVVEKRKGGLGRGAGVRTCSLNDPILGAIRAQHQEVGTRAA